MKTQPLNSHYAYAYIANDRTPFPRPYTVTIPPSVAGTLTLPNIQTAGQLALYRKFASSFPLPYILPECGVGID